MNTLCTDKRNEFKAIKERTLGRRKALRLTGRLFLKLRPLNQLEGSQPLVNIFALGKCGVATS
jgi:hypothetical protein